MPKKIRFKKPKFKGNQYTKSHIDSTTTTAETQYEKDCASSLKIKACQKLETEITTDDFNFIMNFDILKNVIEKFSMCPVCSNSLTLNNNIKSKRGFCLNFQLWCEFCNTKVSDFETSTECNKKYTNKTTGRGVSTVNLRMVIGFREFGKGLASIQTFARCMNMPNPMTKKNYSNINQILHEKYTEAANESTFQAAQETVILLNGSLTDIATNCQVSIDGTWQKRGHASINGVVTLMSRENGKCIDTYVFSKSCKGCQYWSKRKNDSEYNEWNLNHKCLANHDKASGVMESAGAVKMFARSIEKNKLRYTSYIGDGDTSSFNDVINSKPYGDNVVIDKKECVGHVQKRMGTRLRNLRQEKKGVVLSDNKKIMGKGRLTDKAVNTLQNYYGMAIRQNTDNIYVIKKCIWAVLYHNSDITDLVERHKFCPRSDTSWCIWQADQVTSQNRYKVKLSLPVAICNLIKPIFIDLSADSLLTKCLHGGTQNNNESINNVIWKKCPKQTHVSKKILEIGVSSAILEFNEGTAGIFSVFLKLGIHTGKYMNKATSVSNATRISSALKSSKQGLVRRKKLRAIKKGFSDKEKETEQVDSYISGAY